MFKYKADHNRKLQTVLIQDANVKKQKKKQVEMVKLI